MTADTPLDHLEPDQRPRHAGGPLLNERLPAEKLRLLPAHDPPEPRLEHAGRLVDVLAAEPHRRLEPERVTGPEPNRAQPRGRARRQQCPQSRSATCGATKISNPSSPVYPVREIVDRTCATSPVANR